MGGMASLSDDGRDDTTAAVPATARCGQSGGLDESGSLPPSRRCLRSLPRGAASRASNLPPTRKLQGRVLSPVPDVQLVTD